jgi:hypothetical protein
MLSQRSERGATLIEFALIVPLLLLLVFGIIEFGFVFNADSNVNQAARAGGRTAAILSTDPQMGFRAAEAAANSLGIEPASIVGTPTVCVGRFDPSTPNACTQNVTQVSLVHLGTAGSPVWTVQNGNDAPGVYPANDGWPLSQRHFGCAQNSQPGTYDKVVVHVSIKHKLIIPGLFSGFLGGTNTPTVSATSVFQLEPVPSNSCAP